MNSSSMFMDTSTSYDVDDGEYNYVKPLPTEFVFVKSMTCQSCNIVLNSRSQASAHFEGKQHLKNLKSQGIPTTVISEKSKEVAKKRKQDVTAAKTCDLCGLSFNSSSQYEVHLEGSKHKRKSATNGNHNSVAYTQAEQRSSMECDVSTNGSLSNKKAKQDHSTISCKICHDEFNSLSQYEAHVSGQKHKKKLLSGGLPPLNDVVIPESVPTNTATTFFSCDTCNITVNSPQQLDAHFSGEKHKNRLVPKEASELYSCHNCNVRFSSVLKLTEHVNTAEHLEKINSKLASKSSE